ncbi:Rhodanese-like domain-containing protein [Hypoxylon sp. FL1150]|nr:Rhodanese-like domain-containing protein [Hypoxylon sp. FL1150]
MHISTYLRYRGVFIIHRVHKFDYPNFDFDITYQPSSTEYHTSYSDLTCSDTGLLCNRLSTCHLPGSHSALHTPEVAPKMSMITVSSLQRISASKLADMLLANANQVSSASSVAIVDVRDDDHIGGHIRSSLHFPSRSLDAMMPTLVRKLADKDVVVFHCALSQQRGPSAALQYLRAKEGASAVATQKLAESENDEKEGGGELAKKQTVYVLDRGFVGWQEVYGPDERLTEAYRKEIWEDGY